KNVIGWRNILASKARICMIALLFAIPEIHMQELYTQTASANSLVVNKVLRNTYMLLSMTLVLSAVTAAIAMAVGLSHGVGIIMMLSAMGLIWFVLPRTANSSTGLIVVFAVAALIGASLGPIINYYLA